MNNGFIWEIVKVQKKSPKRRICLRRLLGRRRPWWTTRLKKGFRNLKFLFSKIVKGEASILSVKSRNFKLSEYLNNFFQLGVPPLTFLQNKSVIFMYFQLDILQSSTLYFKKKIISHKSTNPKVDFLLLSNWFHENFH